MRLKFGDDGIPIKQEIIEGNIDSVVDEKKQQTIGEGSSSLSRKRIKKEYTDDVGTPLLTYKEAKRLITEDKNCGLKEVYDKRHITIGWHQCGHVAEAVKYIFSKSLGRYRHQLKAVPLAIGNIEIPENPLIIADQPCMHLDAGVRTIIFRPIVDHQYKCVVTSVGKRLVTAKIFNTITFIAPLKDVINIPQVGDEVLIRYQKVDVKESICQMKGVLVQRRTKKRKRKFEEDE